MRRECAGSAQCRRHDDGASTVVWFCFIFVFVFFVFFFNDTATTEIYTLSLHDALPIFCLYLDILLAVEMDKTTDTVIMQFQISKPG